jgi:arsenate reductase
MALPLLPVLSSKVELLLSQFDDVSPRRRQRLSFLAEELRSRLIAGQPIRLNFICTHNSRRSQLGQVWAAVAAFVNDVPGVRTFSGGTEATAFNPRAVAALQRAGFSITEDSTRSESGNPRYVVRFSEAASPLECFSKVHDAPGNPKEDFLAIMTCGEADENCPVILGAKRISLLYEDPKVADETAVEATRYDERSDQIGLELLWAFREARRQ